MILAGFGMHSTGSTKRKKNARKSVKKRENDSNLLISGIRCRHEFVNDAQSYLYVGEVKNSAVSGTGRMYYAYSGEMLYEGGFKGGSFHGAGTFYNVEGTVLKKGNLVDGAFQG